MGLRSRRANLVDRPSGGQSSTDMTRFRLEGASDSGLSHTSHAAQQMLLSSITSTMPSIVYMMEILHEP